MNRGDAILAGRRRVVAWDRAVWWRSYHPGGFDGYRTLTGRRLPCGTLEIAVRRPDLRAQIRFLSRPKRWRRPPPPCSM